MLEEAPEKDPVHVHTPVRLVNPQRRTITRTTGQPGFIEAYEQTSIYPRVAGFIDKWKVDIGDRIKKGEEIAHVFVPDLEAQLREKKAQVELDAVQIRVAQETANVAEQTWKASIAQVLEAKATVNKYEADVERWKSEEKRLASVAKDRVLDPQILDETRKQVKSSIAARDAAKATATAAEATQYARKADYNKAKVDIEAARARARVNVAAEERVAALVGYTHLHAPYDGVVVQRNVDTGDYVQPATGDQSGPRSIQERPSRRGIPLYVVARTDKVRIFLDVPEMQATGVVKGSKALVHVQADNDEVIPAVVTRTSWALDPRTRTLRAEIDLPNPDGRIRANMYAFGDIEVSRPNVWAVPMSTVVQIGNQNCCYLFEDGKAVQTPVQLGINDGKWVEVAKKRENGKWASFTGKEEVIEADLSEISDGQHVRVEKEEKDKK